MPQDTPWQKYGIGPPKNRRLIGILSKWLFDRKLKCIGSRPSDHYFCSVCWFVYVCLFFCLFVCAEFFSAVFDPISIKLGHMLYVWV